MPTLKDAFRKWLCKNSIYFLIKLVYERYIKDIDLQIGSTTRKRLKCKETCLNWPDVSQFKG